MNKNIDKLHLHYSNTYYCPIKVFYRFNIKEQSLTFKTSKLMHFL